MTALRSARVVALRPGGTDAYGRPRLECVLAGQWRRTAFDGVVSAEAGGTLTLASSGSTITVVIPAWFDPSKLAVGDHVIAYFVRRPDGSYAIEAVANGKMDEVELSPQNAYVRRLQHQLVERHELTARSTGKEPNRRLRIYTTAD